jgi:GT2 family glycosyltransferase
MASQELLDLSIIIVSFNTRKLLEECLESVYGTRPNVSFEVIIVDNASSDGSGEMVTKQYPTAILIQNHNNSGFAAAINQGLRRSRGRCALFLNSDTRICVDALERMVAFLKSNPGAGIVGPQLLNPNGTLQPSGNRIPTVWRQLWWCLPFHRKHDPAAGLSRYLDTCRDYNCLVEVDEVSGAALMVRREVWESIGLLDENYFFYFEDVDFCIRAKRAGWRVLYLPSAKIVHHWGMSVREAGVVIQVKSLPGHFHYMRKVHGRLPELAFRIVVIAKSVLKLLLLLPRYITTLEDRGRKIKLNLEIVRISIGLFRSQQPPG